MHAIRSAAHAAFVDPMTGQGILVLPDPAADVRDPLTPGSTVHAADWQVILRQLDRLGWSLAEGDDGGWLSAGETDDGRALLGLFGHDPVISEPDLPDLIAADEALRRLASA